MKSVAFLASGDTQMLRASLILAYTAYSIADKKVLELSATMQEN
jgi:hypothetical protein